MKKAELIALAVAFGIITEGLTVLQLQEQLDATPGYKLYLEQLSAKEAAEARIIELEGDLRIANELLAKETSTSEELRGQMIERSDYITNLVGEMNAQEAGKLIAEEKIGELQETIQALLKEADSLNDIEVIAETVTATPPFEFEGNQYAFTNLAPDVISFNDHAYTQEELINDKEALASLIIGGNSFIKQI